MSRNTVRRVAGERLPAGIISALTNVAVGNSCAVVLRRMKARTVCKTTVNNFAKLRITQAYIQLLSIPENAIGTRMVSLLWVDKREIRMFEPTEDYSVDAPLFWLELFDHDRQTSLDSCNCHDIDSGVLSFEVLVAQAAIFDESLPERGSESQS